MVKKQNASFWMSLIALILVIVCLGLIINANYVSEPSLAPASNINANSCNADEVCEVNKLSMIMDSNNYITLKEDNLYHDRPMIFIVGGLDSGTQDTKITGGKITVTKGLYVGSGSSLTQINEGTIKATNLPTITGGLISNGPAQIKFVCIDSSGTFFKKATPCA